MKRVCVIIVIMSMCLVFAGGQKEARGEEKPRFVFIVKDMTNPYYWRMRAGAQRAAKELGVNLTWLAAQFNGDIEGQVGIVESQLELAPDALILVPMNATSLVPQVRQANQLGIPVFIPDTRLQEGAADYVSFIGVDEKKSAMQMAQFLVDYFGGKAKLAILEGFRGSSTAEERLIGFHEVFDAEPGMNVVASQPADWDREKGFNVTEDILQVHPDIDLVVASNDNMALGAIQAIKAAGKMDQITVTGDDAIPAVLAALRRGEILATIDGNTDEYGYKAVEAAFQYVVNGEELPKWIKVPSRIILKDDVTDEYLNARGVKLD